MQPREDDSEVTVRLLESFSDGVPETFERLFERYRPRLERLVEKRLDPRLLVRVDSADVLQETRLEAFRRLGDFFQRRPMPFRLWLLKTTCEQIRRVERFHLRTAKRSLNRQLPLPDQSSLRLAVADNETPSAPVHRQETAARVRMALARLSESDREIVMLRNFEDVSNNEVAQMLEVSPEAARKRYRRALFRLQNLLGGTQEGPPKSAIA